MARQQKRSSPSSDDDAPSSRAMWKGAISFGLVNITVSLHSATRSEELKFRLLRSRDLSPVNYKRVAEADGKEVPWNEIVKGYEYEKGKFVVLKDEDFRRVDIEATQTIDIVDFVSLDEVNPIFYMRPYYVQPLKGSGPAYALLRDVLADSRKAGIAKVVIRSRQHLAALKANGQVLVLELMHFADELTDQKTVSAGAARAPGRKEVEMAKTLVAQMTEKWDPKRYSDDYRSSLMHLIEKKVSSGGRELPQEHRRAKRASNVVDLASILQQSLQQSASSGEGRARAPARKHAA